MLIWIQNTTLIALIKQTGHKLNLKSVQCFNKINKRVFRPQQLRPKIKWLAFIIDSWQ